MPLQISEQSFEALIYCFVEWRYWNVGGNNLIKPARLRRITRMFYEGLRLHEIRRRTGTHTYTVGKIRKGLLRFLSGCPQWPAPTCACGKPLFHHSVCPVWDTYHAAAVTKGHVTQSKAAQQRHADIFFQTTHAMNTITTAPQSDLATQAQQFCRLIQQGIDAWTDAGKLLVAMIEADPNARQTILDLNPDVTEEILARFEAIGRNQLHPKTLLNNSPGMRRLRALPFSEQTKFLQQPVPVLIKTQAGVDTLNVAVKNLTAQQALQVFTSNGVRSAEAQRAWIESRRSKQPAKGAPYTIKGGKVTFRADTELTARELAQILAQLN